MTRTIVGTLLLASEFNWILPIDRQGQLSTFGLDLLFGLITGSVLLAALILAVYTIVTAFRRPAAQQPSARVERRDRHRAA